MLNADSQNWGGYTAGAILDCILQFTKILDGTSKNNLLVQACRIYLSCDYILAAFIALANFTYKVTMPLLNCVVKSNQSTLLQVLKALHDDLKKGDMNTLRDFHVEWKYVNMAAHQPSSLENMILKQMCQEAAKGV